MLRPRPGFESRRGHLSCFCVVFFGSRQPEVFGKSGAWFGFFGGFALDAPLDSGGVPHMRSIWPSRRGKRAFGGLGPSPRREGSENRILNNEEATLFMVLGQGAAAAPLTQIGGVASSFSGINRTLSSALPPNLIDG